LLENATLVGTYLLAELLKLKDKHALIGDVRGKGLFAGLELVKNRDSKEPVDEAVVMKIAAHCLESGVIIGRTNRSLRQFNNTIILSPALIATKEDIDEITAALDSAFAVTGD
jgi:taurine-pyruvate aminotransferase